ncbi:lipocalin-like protein [Gillisia sp. Hel_I_86]|uniref:lipocalin family protein n=1 Tax=Gillisia sp. Hel_I_86 TaxID=1249981 RepID=UPI00119C7FBD|nr:lipocalin family protein [Gillisia sp. Hel_I_86]TVZ28036.1 lipocalin-like protein [Gillisia sp. Hel_I_86]
MKKIFLLFFSLALLTSCSSDDDERNAGDDKILGKWFVAEINNTGALNIEENDCNRQSFIDFKSNFKADSALYAEDGGECNVNTSENDDWSIVGESKYRFVIPFEGIGAQSGRVDFNEDFTKFTFYPDLFLGQNTNIVFEKR